MTIRSENLVKQQEWACSRHHIHQAGGYVHVCITDTGPGIPEEVRGRLFEPFVSTKFIGRGLGLAAAFGIAVNHGGCIEVDESLADGASFHILLPRAREEDERQPGRVTAAPRNKGQTVLLVDDEPPVLELLQEVLRLHGFEVLTAASGLEALALFRTSKARISLVVLDIQLPDIDGKEVYREMRSVQPDIPVLISSGHDKEVALVGLELASGDGFIHKPYRPAAFVEIVKRTLKP